MVVSEIITQNTPKRVILTQIMEMIEEIIDMRNKIDMRSKIEMTERRDLNLITATEILIIIAI